MPRVTVRSRPKGVPSAIYYPVPMHRQPPYKAFPASACGLEVTRDLCERVLALPMHPCRPIIVVLRLHFSRQPRLTSVILLPNWFSAVPLSATPILKFYFQILKD